MKGYKTLSFSPDVCADVSEAECFCSSFCQKTTSCVLEREEKLIHGHLDLWAKTLLLRNRRTTVSVRKGMRARQDYPHWGDFTVNVPCLGTGR